MPGRKKEEPMDQSGNVKKQQTNVQINQGQFNSGKQLEIERPEHDEEAAGGQSRLFVGGLPQGVATDQVRGLFKLGFQAVFDLFCFSFEKVQSLTPNTAIWRCEGCLHSCR